MDVREIGAGGWPFGSAILAATAAGTPYSATNFLVVPMSGYLAKLVYVPSAAITANGTNFQTLNVRNGTASGAGTTVMGTRAWSAGNSAANTPEVIPLSGTAANLLVNAGDILHYVSTVGGSGVALPAASLVAYIVPRN